MVRAACVCRLLVLAVLAGVQALLLKGEGRGGEHRGGGGVNDLGVNRHVWRGQVRLRRTRTCGCRPFRAAAQQRPLAIASIFRDPTLPHISHRTTGHTHKPHTRMRRISFQSLFPSPHLVREDGAVGAGVGGAHEDEAGLDLIGVQDVLTLELHLALLHTARARAAGAWGLGRRGGAGRVRMWVGRE